MDIAHHVGCYSQHLPAVLTGLIDQTCFASVELLVIVIFRVPLSADGAIEITGSHADDSVSVSYFNCLAGHNFSGFKSVLVVSFWDFTPIANQEATDPH